MTSFSWRKVEGLKYASVPLRIAQLGDFLLKELLRCRNVVDNSPCLSAVWCFVVGYPGRLSIPQYWVVVELFFSIVPGFQNCCRFAKRNKPGSRLRHPGFNTLYLVSTALISTVGTSDATDVNVTQNRSQIHRQVLLMCVWFIYRENKFRICWDSFSISRKKFSFLLSSLERRSDLNLK